MGTRRLLALVGAMLVVSNIYISTSIAADRPVAESNFITPIQNGDGTVYKLTVTFNAYVANCQSLNRIGFKVDNESASYDSSFMRAPKIKTGVFTEDFEIRTDTWTEGTHTITPVAYDSCYTAYSDSSKVTSVSITVPKFITTTLLSPSQNAIANKPFDVTIQVTGVQAKTISAAALDMSGGAWIKPPTFMGIDKRKDDPTAAYTFASAHQHAVAFWLSPATTFTWRVDPTGWNTGTRNLQVTVLDLAGRQYLANTQVVVPQPTTAAIRVSNQIGGTTGTLVGLATLDMTASIFPNSGYTVKKIWIEVSDLPAGNVDGLKMPVIKANFTATVEPGSNLLTWVLPDGLSSSTFSFQVDTSSWKNGSHTFKAWLTDSAGTTAASNQVSVSTSNNPPNVTILETPQMDLLQSQSLKMNVATGLLGSAKLAFISVLLNGKALNSFPGVRPNFVATTTGADYSLPSASTLEPSWTIDASKWAEGDYTLLVSTTDSNGRVSLAVTKSFNLFNSAERARLTAERARLMVLKDQIDDVFQSSGGIDELSATLQDLLDQANTKSKTIRNLTRQGGASTIDVASLNAILNARQTTIDTLENKTYKFLNPLVTNCATASSLSVKSRANIETSRNGIQLIEKKNKEAIAESPNLSRIAAAVSKLDVAAPLIPDLLMPPRTLADATQTALMSAQQFQKDLAKRVALAKRYLADLAPYQDEAQTSLENLRRIQDSAQRIRNSVAQTIGSQSTFSASIKKEQSYLQICDAIQKVAKKGKSKLPPVKIEVPSDPITTIYCTNGTITKPVRGVAPSCPDGFSKEDS